MKRYAKEFNPYLFTLYFHLNDLSLGKLSVEIQEKIRELSDLIEVQIFPPIPNGCDILEEHFFVQCIYNKE